MAGRGGGAVRELWEEIGRPPTVAGLSTELSMRLPRGSEAKLAAIERGEPPPGSDPEVSARLHLEHPTVGVSCWVQSGLVAALASQLDGVERAGVMVLSRVDPTAPAVDFHGSAVVETPSGRVISDPYFDADAVPDDGGIAHGPGSAVEVTDVDGTVVLSVSQCWSVGTLRYRQVSGALAPRHTEPFCRLSATYGSVHNRSLGLRTPSGRVNVAPAGDAGYRVTRWELGPTDVRGTPAQIEVVGSWEGAVELAFSLKAAALQRR